MGSLLAPATLRQIVVLAGLGQLLLVAASPAIPRALGWREELRGVRPLTRQVFWTWAAYVWLTHLAFGLLSVFGAEWLLAPDPLPCALAGFIAAWWGARLVLQFIWFDRSAAPPGLRYRLGEAALVALFVFLTAVYGTVCALGLAAAG